MCKKKWSEEEVATLILLWESRESRKSIAKTFDRTIDSITGKVYELRKQGFDLHTRSDKPWSKRDVALLTTMWDSGNTGPEIMKATGRTRDSVYTMLRNIGLQGKKYQKMARWEFSEYTPDLGYVLGCYLSDAYFTGKIVGMATIDEDFVDSFAKSIESLVDYVPKRHSNGYMYIATARCSDLGYWLEKETNNKSCIPDAVFKLPRPIRLEVIAGAMDGDGWISKSKKIGGNYKSAYLIGIAGVLDWVHDLARLLSTVGVLYGGPYITQSKNYPLNTYVLNKKSVSFSDFYFKMQRKQERLLHMKQLYNPQRLIRSDPRERDKIESELHGDMQR
jgi:hypothetical protein